MDHYFTLPRFFFASAVLLILCMCGALAQPQMYIVSSPDTSAYRNVSVKFYAIDQQGSLIRSLVPEDFAIWENFITRPVIDVTCPPLKPPSPVSAVLAIDVSGSMKELEAGIVRMELAKLAADTWVQAMKGDDETAVTSFNDANYLNQDFTPDVTYLTTAIHSLEPKGGTSFVEGLVGYPSGAVNVAKRGKQRRIVIFLTDGYAVVNESDKLRILNSASASDVEIYAIVLGISADPVLKSIANESGGFCFEYIRTLEELQGIYRAIRLRTQGVEPCTVVWESGPTCEAYRFVQLDVPKKSLYGTTSYFIDDASFPGLQITPTAYDFGPVTPGETHEIALTMVLGKDPPDGSVVIQEVRSDNPLFTIKELRENPNFFPEGMLAGDTIHLTLQFTPINFDRTNATITVKTSLCKDQKLSYSGGNDPGVRTSIRLVKPNGGEEFVIGVDTILRWDRVLFSDPVRLDYSIDEGKTWSVITPRTKGLVYNWTVPPTPSRRCLARVTQLNPDQLYSLLKHNQEVVDARFVDNGNSVVTLDKAGLVHIWNTNTGGETGQLGGAFAAHHLVVSPDSRYVAVGGSVDRTVLVWDVRSGASKDVFQDAYLTGGGVNSNIKSPLCFTPDGAALLTAKVAAAGDISTTTLRLYDVETGLLVKEISDPLVACRYAAYSPNGSVCAIAGVGGTIRIRDASLSNVISTLKDPNGDVVRLSFSRDGRQLLSLSQGAGGRKMVSLWDVNQGVRIKSIAVSSSLKELDFSPTTQSMLLADGEGVLQGLLSDELERVFTGHTAAVNAARFSDDGRLVVTVGDDKMGRVWRIDNGLVHADTSEALWAIIAPEIQSRDVEFGNVVLGAQKDSVLTAYVRNTGNVEATVTEMRITGAGRNDFTIISGRPPFTIPIGGSQTVELGFHPGIAGDRDATLEIRTVTQKLEQHLHGIGVEPALKLIGLSGDFIDFGPVSITKSRDSLAAIVNTGSASVTLTGLAQSGPDLQQFTILAPDLSTPVTLDPNDTLWVLLRFSPIRLGLTQGGIDVAYDGDGSPARIGLLGEGITISDPAIAGPLTLDFAPQECLPYPDTMTFQISNPGSAELKVSDVIVEGVNRNEFTLIPAFVPFSVAVGETYPLTVAFTPSGFGPYTAILRLQSNASNTPDYQIDVNGNVVKSEVLILPETIDLGILCPGAVVEFPITLYNVGRVGTELQGMIANESGGSLRLLSNSAVVDADDSVTVLLEVSAAIDTGLISGTITFIETLCGASATVTLVGEVRRPTIHVDPVPVLCPGESAALSASGGLRYQWSPGEGLSCVDCVNPIATPTTTTTYIVRGYDEWGCVGMDSVTVQVRAGKDVVPVQISRLYRAAPGSTTAISLEVVGNAPELQSVEEMELNLTFDPSVVNMDVQEIEKNLVGTLLEGWSVDVADEKVGSATLRCERGVGGRALTGPGTLMRVSCRAFLSRVLGTDLGLQVKSYSPCVEFVAQSGYMRVDSICGLPYRLIEFGTGKYALRSVTPDPAYGDRLTIGFSLGLDGPTHLEIFNSEGELVEVLIDAELKAGSYGIDWDMEKVGSGLYYYRLSSGAWSGTGKVMVVK